MVPEILMIEQQTDWVALFSALAVPLAAFIAVGVAVWQAHVQEQQLKLGLYARRVEVYFSLRKFLSDIAIGNRPLDFDQCMQLLRETKEAEFLFRSRSRNANRAGLRESNSAADAQSSPYRPSR